VTKADVAELVDARDLKFPATTESAAIFCKTADNTPAVSAAHPRILQNISEAYFVASEPTTRGHARAPPAPGGRLFAAIPTTLPTNETRAFHRRLPPRNPCAGWCAFVLRSVITDQAAQRRALARANAEGDTLH
jgi:hypothetical protein